MKRISSLFSSFIVSGFHLRPLPESLLGIQTLVLLLFAGLTFTGCAAISQRSSASGYSSRVYETDLSRDRQRHERQIVLSDMGVQDFDAPVSAEAFNLRRSVHRAEKTLEGRREREQYFHHKPYLRSDSERLEFLSLPSFEVRQRWLNARGVQTGPGMIHPAPIQALIEINDITVGMTKQAVRESWGEPEVTEVAGNPVYGNERWQYKEETSSADGYQTQERWVYFESGRVSGWESR